MDKKVFDVNEIYDIPGSRSKIAMSSVGNSADIFDEDSFSGTETPVPGYEGAYWYIPFGADNELPFMLAKTIGEDEILSQNMYFNVLTAYGAGLKYADPLTGIEAKGEPRAFFMRNSLKEFCLEQLTDMKYYFFAVAAIILDADGKKIVQVRHKDACYCRFEKADKKGRINHVFYANWRKTAPIGRKDVEILQILDFKDPLGQLEVLMGRAPGEDGQTFMRTSNRKFAIVMKFPTPGQQYYPIPYYTSIFKGDWFDLKKLIGKAKKAKIRNHAGIKYQVEIDRQYWEGLIMEEGITDPEQVQARIKREKENIRDFVTGIENGGKMWITGCYTDVTGREQRLVKINVIDTSKEGGDWSDDISEAANMLCYGTGVHPNLIGANPGKSQSNNSGSDKRELFTLKQATETATRDILRKVHDVILHFNGWSDMAEPVMPIVQLTTLDQHKDLKETTTDQTN